MGLRAARAGPGALRAQSLAGSDPCSGSTVLVRSVSVCVLGASLLPKQAPVCSRLVGRAMAVGSAGGLSGYTDKCFPRPWAVQLWPASHLVPGAHCVVVGAAL